MNPIALSPLKCLLSSKDNLPSVLNAFKYNLVLTNMNNILLKGLGDRQFVF